MYSSAAVAGCEALRQQIDAQVQAMVGDLVALVSQRPQSLADLEQAVLAQLKPLGNALLTGLRHLYAPRYPAATVACPCGGAAVYQRQRTGQCKSLLGTLQL